MSLRVFVNLDGADFLNRLDKEPDHDPVQFYSITLASHEPFKLVLTWFNRSIFWTGQQFYRIFDHIVALVKRFEDGARGIDPPASWKWKKHLNYLSW